MEKQKLKTTKKIDIRFGWKQSVYRYSPWIKKLMSYYIRSHYIKEQRSDLIKFSNASVQLMLIIKGRGELEIL